MQLWLLSCRDKYTDTYNKRGYLCFFSISTEKQTLTCFKVKGFIRGVDNDITHVFGDVTR